MAEAKQKLNLWGLQVDSEQSIFSSELSDSAESVFLGSSQEVMFVTVKCEYVKNEWAFLVCQPCKRGTVGGYDQCNGQTKAGWLIDSKLQMQLDKAVIFMHVLSDKHGVISIKSTPKACLFFKDLFLHFCHYDRAVDILKRSEVRERVIGSGKVHKVLSSGRLLRSFTSYQCSDH